MEIFKIIAVIPIVIIFVLLGIVCLKLAKLPTSLLSVSIFSNSDGKLDSSANLLGIFIIAGVFSVMAGMYALSQYAKHNKAVNDRLRLDR